MQRVRFSSDHQLHVKVVLLCRSLDIGGAERQLVILASGLGARGHEVVVVVFYANGQLEQELRDNGVPVLYVHKAGRWDALFFFLRLVRLLRNVQPATLYGFLPTPNILAVLLKPFLPEVRIVWGVRASTVHLNRYDWLARVIYRMECALSRFADLIICNSQAGLEYAARHGFPRDRMITIPNGIDTERFNVDAGGRVRVRGEWGIADGEILIGLVARLDPMKDHPTWLQAAAILARQQAGIRFVCVGDGPIPYKDELHQLATRLGMDSRLTWAGERKDMAAVFSALDVAVSSSSGEGFSNTIAEAMACGVPCVVTDVGDSAVIVGKIGEIVPSAQPDALCDGIRRMLRRLSPELRHAARAAIVDRFASYVFVDRTVAALSQMD